MSAHLLPVTAVWLASLPDGTPLRYGLGSRATHHGCKQQGRPRSIRCYGLRLRVGDSVRVWLDMSDPLTAAAVAAKIVLPWAVVDRPHGQELMCSREEHGVMADAAWMKPLTSDQIDTLTRLARAAMEAS